MAAPAERVLDDLFAHCAWANALLFDDLRVDPSLDAEVLRLLNHVIAAEHLWLSRIHGSEPRVAVWPALPLDDLEAMGQENAAGFAELLAPGSVAGLARVVHYRNTAGRVFDNTVRDILLHVAMHGHYHRGQIATRMRAVGRTPVYTDYIGWARRNQ